MAISTAQVENNITPNWIKLFSFLHNVDMNPNGKNTL